MRQKNEGDQMIIDFGNCMYNVHVHCIYVQQRWGVQFSSAYDLNKTIPNLGYVNLCNM